MVLCKFFQQGSCRFGQYCKFEHSFGNRSKTFGDEKNIALMVAEDILNAERGRQWLLSCYGPFKERKCIPGMEDVSPEEVRWEMYQAQKNGTADQINAQFQQMCETMKTKRDALKNPTSAIVQLLEEIQNSGAENTSFGNNSKLNKGNFAFGTPQLGISNTNQTSSVFGQKSFGASNNPFGNSTSSSSGGSFNSMQASSSIFVRPTTYNSNSVFGGKPSFGSAPVFGSPSATGTSIFGNVNKSAAPAFGSVQNAPSFGGLASQGSLFGSGASAQSGFGQPATFGASSGQASGSFLKAQGSQPSVFGSVVATPVQPGNVFGAAIPGAGVTTTAQSSVFGANPGSSPASGTGLFGQTTTTNAAFGGAPVFGGTSTFGTAQAQTGGGGGAGTGGSMFGGQSAFGGTNAVSSSSSSVFGGSNSVTSSFGVIAQTANAGAGFGVAAPAASTNAFEATTSSAPFGTPISTAAGPFGALNTTAQSHFGTGMSSYSKGVSFGFAAPATEAGSIFGTSVTTSTFGGTGFASPQAGSSVFARLTTTATTTTTTTTAASVGNVFLAKPQQQGVVSPFGIASTQSSSQGIFATPTASGFGIAITVMIDETAYSAENVLTDDEKAAYRMNLFSEGHIPIRPPTKELS
ncbi:PREDICTED: nuclear pore complex protein Nup98-Nup96-like [Ceratosolen solmsi marchali]|uniref:Nucleoporin NUP42 n=1 Tax=Ceratosolen solmsi marchali TaxID=326594 RepID=A0AAJ6YGA8_9HYME|nr:PREDICTED: nuclear pore complex protein Nup98-Nup96-like [Ceratosolen solmsi marchali]